MRAAAVALGMVLLQSSFDHTADVDASPERFRVQRTLSVPAAVRGQACAIVDAAVYAHTEGRLTALRLYRLDGQSVVGEVPFAFTESGEAGQQEEPAKASNLGRRGKAVVFDLAMPPRTYTAVVLALQGRDFYAEAKISGSDGHGGIATDLGTFALFDLRSQGLSRSTTLPLQEVSFPLLHVELTVTPAPGSSTVFTPEMVTGAQVPPSREAQTLYTPVATTSTFATKGHESLASLSIPAHVPIERARFGLPPTFTRNFSRDVRLTAYAGPKRSAPVAPRDSYLDETISATIQRVHLTTAAGGPIRSDQTSIEAMFGANLRSDGTVEVAIENGDDAPLPLTDVELQMRQRKLCFDAEPGATYVLRYGDVLPVRAPVYDYARLFEAIATAADAALGPEMPNPDLKPEAQQPDTRSYTERHPELLWVVLLAVISVLGMVAVRSAKQARDR